MNKTKLALATAVLAVCLLAINLWAQVYGYSTLDHGLTYVAATKNSNVINSAAAYVGKQQTVGLIITAELDDAGTNGPATFVFARSVDGTTYQTLNQTTVELTMNGTTAVKKITELDLYGAGYFKLLAITNADEAALTNISVTYAVKIDAP